jgi:HisA/HisF family protein
MTLIPVIDLLKGQVVRALRGHRSAYRPIRSALCDSADPPAVAQILCEYTAARCLYVADLDGLGGGEVQTAMLQRIMQLLPGLDIWLDAGFRGPEGFDDLLQHLGAEGSRVVPVYASEALPNRAALQACLVPSAPAAGRAVLSLDRRDGRVLDAADCWNAPELWPERVIVMTLERVGAAAGPDLDTLRAVQARSPGTRLIGAGGIRDAADLAHAAAAGADAWLVASALHDLRLPRVQG